MSELKVRPYTMLPSGQCYDRDEADKVIALLTDKANYNEYAYKLKSEELADTCRFYEDEIRRQKHKRCLAMANYWGLTSACTHGEIQLKCMRRELKWHKLAEKFKETEK